MYIVCWVIPFVFGLDIALLQIALEIDDMLFHLYEMYKYKFFRLTWLLELPLMRQFCPIEMAWYVLVLDGVDVLL